jgi:hypothetical protein
MGVQVPPRTPRPGKFPLKQTPLEYARPKGRRPPPAGACCPAGRLGLSLRGPVLVLAMGTALAHMLRADAAEGAPDNRTERPATPRSPGDRSAPGRDQGADRVRSFGRDQDVPAPGSRRDRADHETRPTGRTATGGPRPPYRPQACRCGKASVTASPAQQWGQGLQRGAQRPGTQEQHRACSRSSAQIAAWIDVDQA